MAAPKPEKKIAGYGGNNRRYKYDRRHAPYHIMSRPYYNIPQEDWDRIFGDKSTQDEYQTTKGDSEE